jgi:glycosyltransferase involved in cell wall biosynthesis
MPLWRHWQQQIHRCNAIFFRLGRILKDCTRPMVHMECLQELYARSDVQVIPQELGTGDGSLPSKLPNLMAEGVPVFVICDDGSEVGRLVQSASAGYVANTWEPHALVAEFQAQKEVLLAEPRAARRARLREYVREHFSVERVVHEILRG